MVRPDNSQGNPKMSVLEIVQRATMMFTALLLLSGCVAKEQYDALAARYQQLNERLSSQNIANQMQIARLQDSIKITVNDELLFPRGGWQMPVKAQQTIAPLVAALASMQQTKIMVNGYTDNMAIGPDLMDQGITSNLMLSEKRADTVMRFMISQGVNPSMVSAQGFGDADPVASNHTEAGRAQNRRVELMLAGSGSEMLADSLPPTRVVPSSPSVSPSPASAQSAPAIKSLTDPKPSIIWHQVHGRWHWHCLANCAKYRSYHAEPGEAASDFSSDNSPGSDTSP
jgi:chemotaxis protein MotB